MLVRQHALLVSCLCLGFCTPGLRAAPTPAAIFGDGMVLQRDRPLEIWGTASKNERVTGEFAGQTRTTNADDDGHWTITLAGSRQLVRADDCPCDCPLARRECAITPVFSLLKVAWNIKCH